MNFSFSHIKYFLRIYPYWSHHTKYHLVRKERCGDDCLVAKQLDFQSWLCLFLRNARIRDSDVLLDETICDEYYYITAKDFFTKCNEMEEWYDIIYISLMDCPRKRTDILSNVQDLLRCMIVSGYNIKP